MKFDILTLFPEQIESFIQYGIFRIAREDGEVEIVVNDLRKWTTDKHKSVDDKPYGGGAGMVLKVEPIFKALEDLRTDQSTVIITTPKGRRFDQEYAKDLASRESSHYIIVCGHYEGIDERVHEYLVDEEISIGDYVLSGGELPALSIVDSVVRLLPGVLGNTESAQDESFEDGTLEYPQYTRPEKFEGWDVPNVLLSGNHKEIDLWRKNKARKVTEDRRPDLKINK